MPDSYSLVPLPDEILYPAWSSQVSLDMPFKDGWYGYIRFRITARTPIYVRQALHQRPQTIAKPSSDRTQWADFFRIGGAEGNYGIPASSLNGMLRAVLAPATFGKLCEVGTTPGARPGWYAKGSNLAATKEAREKLRAAGRGGVQPEERPDFTETLLGYAGETDAQAKRVSFSDAVAQENPEIMDEVGIRFYGPNGYSRRYTNPFCEDDAVNPWLQAVSLGGWKRYPRVAELRPHPRPSSNDKQHASYFRPLPIGTTFLTDLHLWNVRCEELGALLWILTWGQFGISNPGKYCHQIGHAKPFGYGSITFALELCELNANASEPSKITCIQNNQLDEAIKRFYQVLVAHGGDNWRQSETIANLFEFAVPR